jgi:hypothetical protein
VTYLKGVSIFCAYVLLSFMIKISLAAHEVTARTTAIYMFTWLVLGLVI